MASGDNASFGWAVRSLLWFGQTAFGSLVLLLGIAIAGVGTDLSPALVLLGCAALLGPPLLLRQVSLLLEARMAGVE